VGQAAVTHEVGFPWQELDLAGAVITMTVKGALQQHRRDRTDGIDQVLLLRVLL
jgi:hypothetical protein